MYHVVLTRNVNRKKRVCDREVAKRKKSRFGDFYSHHQPSSFLWEEWIDSLLRLTAKIGLLSLPSLTTITMLRRRLGLVVEEGEDRIESAAMLEYSSSTSVISSMVSSWSRSRWTPFPLLILLLLVLPLLLLYDDDWPEMESESMSH